MRLSREKKERKRREGRFRNTTITRDGRIKREGKEGRGRKI